MRDAGLYLIVLASLSGVARADMVPEDPYTDVSASPKLLSESAHATSLYLKSEQSHAFQPKVEAVAKVAVASKVAPKVSPIASVTSESTDQLDEWYEQQEVQIGGGIGAGLVLLGLLIRSRRAARRRRLLERDRKTQFGMSAVDPMLAKINVAAWEKTPAVMPVAIEPEMMNAGRRAPSAPPVRMHEHSNVPAAPIVRFAQPAPQSFAANAQASVPQHSFVPNVQPAQHSFAPNAPPVPAPAQQHSFAPPPAKPYRHYSEADLAAYKMPSLVAAPVASQPAQPVSAQPVVAPVAPQRGSKPVMMPHLMKPAPMPSMQQAAPMQQPAPMHAVQMHHAHSMQPAPMQPAPMQPAPMQAALVHAQPEPARGSWHPTVLPWNQQAQSVAPHGSQPPHAFAQQPQTPHAQAPQSHAAHAPQPFAPNAAHAPQPFAPNAAHVPQGPQPFTSQSFAPPQPMIPMHQQAQHHARAFAPARFAHGTPHPPIANPQPFVGLPAAHRPLPGMPAHAAPTVAPHLASTQHAPPQSFVLEMSSHQLPDAQETAHYPLTFPAFPEAAGATELAPIEPSGLNYWGNAKTEVQEPAVFARGSQPVEHLEPIRMALPHARPDDETRVAMSPADKRTFEYRRG